MRGGGGEGVVRILQSLMGKSGRLHCDTYNQNQSNPNVKTGFFAFTNKQTDRQTT